MSETKLAIFVEACGLDRMLCDASCPYIRKSFWSGEPKSCRLFDQPLPVTGRFAHRLTACVLAEQKAAAVGGTKP